MIAFQLRYNENNKNVINGIILLLYVMSVPVLTMDSRQNVVIIMCSV